MKTKNPSDITRARRAVDQAILSSAQVISERLSEKARTVHIAVHGIFLAELCRVQNILLCHEQANRRKLTPEAVQEIGSIIGKYTEVKKDDNKSWLGILKPMVEQKRI